jgi:hypothetical protein
MAFSALAISPMDFLGVSVRPETRDVLSPPGSPAHCRRTALLALMFTRFAARGDRSNVQDRASERRQANSSEPGHTVNNGRRRVKGNVADGGNRVSALRENGRRASTSRNTCAHFVVFVEM